ATPFSAIRLSACCALRAGTWTSRITSTIPECKSPTWWLDSCTSSRSHARRLKRSLPCRGLISVAVLKRHLETMDRLDIEYDFLPRESEILHLHFWDAAFTKLKEAGVL